MNDQQLLLERNGSDRSLEENEKSYLQADLEDLNRQINQKSGSEYLKLLADLEEAKGSIRLAEQTILRLKKEKEGNLEGRNRVFIDMKRGEGRIAECSQSIREMTIDRTNLAMESATVKGQIAKFEAEIQNQGRDAEGAKDELFALMQSIEAKKADRSAILHQKDLLLEKSRMRTSERERLEERMRVIDGETGSRSEGAIHILDGEDVEIKNSAVTVTPDEFGPHGIRLDSVKNVAVQNVQIDGGFSGVSFISRGGAGAPTTGRIQDCTIRNGFNSGVLLANTDDASVKNNEGSGCYAGMQIGLFVFVSNIQVSGNNIHHSVAGGIYAWAMIESAITDNAVTDNARFGINLDEACANNVVSGNLVANNGRRGIVLTSYDDPLYGVNNNRISGNTVLDNGLEGISLFLGTNTGNQITDNTVLGNGVCDLFHNAESTPNVWRDNIYNTKSGADIP